MAFCFRYSGKPDETKTLSECGLVKGAKVMVVGSTLTDVFAMAPPPGASSGSTETAAAAETKEPVSRAKVVICGQSTPNLIHLAHSTDA